MKKILTQYAMCALAFALIVPLARAQSQSPGQLGDRECARTYLLVRMGGVHTACDWSGQTVPVDGAEVCTSYSDPHNHVAHDGSPGICHRILSEPWTSVVSFSHN